MAHRKAANFLADFLSLAGFNLYGFAVNAVVAAPVVAYEKPAFINGFNEVQVVIAFDPHQDNVADLQGLGLTGFNGDQITVVDLAFHRMASRFYLNRLSFPQSFYGKFRPTHNYDRSPSFFYKRPARNSSTR
jgi:hypothetical protein